MFFGEGGGELDIQQLYFNTCRGHTFIYPCLGDGGVIATVTVTATSTVTVTVTVTVTTILRYTILLWVYFCLPVFRRSYCARSDW